MGVPDSADGPTIGEAVSLASGGQLLPLRLPNLNHWTRKMTMKKWSSSSKYLNPNPNRSCYCRLRWMLDLRSLAAVRRRLDRGPIKRFNSFPPIVELLFLLAICIARSSVSSTCSMSMFRGSLRCSSWLDCLICGRKCWTHTSTIFKK